MQHVFKKINNELIESWLHSVTITQTEKMIYYSCFLLKFIDIHILTHVYLNILNFGMQQKHFQNKTA